MISACETICGKRSGFAGELRGGVPIRVHAGLVSAMQIHE
jgi:hypothetical protein